MHLKRMFIPLLLDVMSVDILGLAGLLYHLRPLFSY